MDPLTAIATRHTAQNQPADPRQVLNAAGGYAFELGDDARIHRFLTLGTTGGTYYTSERELTKANTDLVLAAARDRGTWLATQAANISRVGRAPRQNPAVFALAAVAGLGDDEARKTALGELGTVCRTGTHLFLFATYVEQFRGWGRGLRAAVGRWYTTKPVDQLAYQAVKYRQRNGWSHRDLLRLAHPDSDEDQRRALFQWIAGHETELDACPPLIEAFVRAQNTTDTATWVELIEQHPISWEMLPDPALGEPAVWRALVAKGLPQTALVRQLPRLTRLDVLDGDTLRTVTAQLQDAERLRKGRVHPVNILVAARTYASGRSAAGTSTWNPDRRIVDALDAGFHNAFQAIEPAGKRTLLALDVSGSMGSPASGLPISCREASAALALVTMATEPDTDVVGFTGGGWARTFDPDNLTELALSPRQRLDDAIRAISDLPFGGTDCALPMVWAETRRREYDTIAIYTDNETWAGNTHPHQALRSYRDKLVPGARLAVVGMTANDVSIADPLDPGTLDVAGFDSAVPNLLADFSRGDI